MQKLPYGDISHALQGITILQQIFTAPPHLQEIHVHLALLASMLKECIIIGMGVCMMFKQVLCYLPTFLVL